MLDISRSFDPHAAYYGLGTPVPLVYWRKDILHPILHPSPEHPGGRRLASLVESGGGAAETLRESR